MNNKLKIIESDLDTHGKILAMVSLIAQEQKNKQEQMLKPFDISPLQLSILDCLCFAINGTMTVNKIKEKLMTESPNVSRSLKKLTALSLVSKQRDEQDQRTVFVTVTAEGRQLRQQVKQAQARVQTELSTDDQNTLFQLLCKI